MSGQGETKVLNVVKGGDVEVEKTFIWELDLHCLWLFDTLTTAIIYSYSSFQLSHFIICPT